MSDITYNDNEKTNISKINDIEYVVIPSKVTTICSESIKNTQNLQTIVFQENSHLNTLEALTFAYSSIQTIDLQECNILSYVSHWCFRGCTKLTNVKLPKNGILQTIKEGAFSQCSALPELLIPETVEAFEDCTGDYNAIFHECASLLNIIFLGNSKLNHLGILMFHKCYKLSSIIIPPLVVNFPYGVFDRCNSLKEIFFSNNRITFGENPFFNLNLSSVFIYVSEKSVKMKLIEIGFPQIQIIFRTYNTCIYNKTGISILHLLLYVIICI